MIGKQGKNFTTAKIFKKVCKTLCVTVTILSPNFLLNNCCIKIMVDTVNYGKRSHDEGDVSTPFLRLSVDVFLFKLIFCSNYVTLRHHVDVKTSSALPYYGKPCKGVLNN